MAGQRSANWQAKDKEKSPQMIINNEILNAVVHCRYYDNIPWNNNNGEHAIKASKIRQIVYV
jgi:hypothetical protein